MWQPVLPGMYGPVTPVQELLDRDGMGAQPRGRPSVAVAPSARVIREWTLQSMGVRDDPGGVAWSGGWFVTRSVIVDFINVGQRGRRASDKGYAFMAEEQTCHFQCEAGSIVFDPATFLAIYEASVQVMVHEALKHMGRQNQLLTSFVTHVLHKERSMAHHQFIARLRYHDIELITTGIRFMDAYLQTLEVQRLSVRRRLWLAREERAPADADEDRRENDVAPGGGNADAPSTSGEEHDH